MEVMMFVILAVLFVSTIVINLDLRDEIKRLERLVYFHEEQISCIANIIDLDLASKSLSPSPSPSPDIPAEEGEQNNGLE